MTWIERQRYFIDTALSSLKRRWRKNLALTVLYILVVSILASIVFFAQAIREEARLVLRDAPDVIVQRLVAGRHDLIPARYVDALRAIAGTTDIQGRLWAYYFDPSTGANYTVIATDQLSRHDGRIIIGQGVARAIGAHKGDMIALRRHDGTYQSFEVKESFSAVSELVTSDLILMSDTDFRGLFGIPPTLFTDIVLTVRNPLETSVVSGKILRMLPDTRAVLKDDILRTYDAVFAWRGGVLLVIFSAAVFAFLICAWDKAGGLSHEERREIGVLRAVGWDTSEVIMLKVWEGIIISLSSFMLGIIFAYVHVFFFSSTIFEPVLKGWAVIYPSFRPVPAVNSSQIAAVFFLTVVPYTAATIIPSWLASTIDPDSVIRL